MHEYVGIGLSQKCALQGLEQLVRMGGFEESKIVFSNGTPHMIVAKKKSGPRTMHWVKLKRPASSKGLYSASIKIS